MIEAKKKYRHGDLAEGLFQFELSENGTVIGTAACAADVKITFDTLHYTYADIGTHTYTIKELTGAENIDWDTHEETVTVTVSKPSDTELAADVSYDADGAVFTNNAYTPKDLTVTKTVSGNMGDKSKEFGFSLTLTPPDGKTCPEALSYTKGEETGTLSLEDGKYSFALSHGESITFKNIDADTQYIVKEEGVLFQGYIVTKENAAGTILDENITASFENYKFVSVPTSADMDKKSMVAMLMLALIVFGMGGIFYVQRKQK